MWRYERCERFRYESYERTQCLWGSTAESMIHPDREAEGKKGLNRHDGAPLGLMVHVMV